MLFRLVSLLLAFCISACAQHARLVLTHVNVVDVTSGEVRADMAVMVTGSQISAVEPASKFQSPQDARVVNATGRYVIPGLWDMHAHTWTDATTRQFVLPLNVVNGVVGLRVMAGDCIGTDCEGKDTFDAVRRWRADIAAGKVVGPFIAASSPFVDGAWPEHAGSISVHGPEEAREAVRYAKRRGVDFVKVYNSLSRESYYVLADEAKRLRIDFAGHVPWVILAREASEVGQRSIDHLLQIRVGCSSEQQKLIARRTELLTTFKGTAHELTQVVESDFRTLPFDQSRCPDLFRTLVHNHTWVVPTLGLYRSDAFEDDPKLYSDDRLRFIPRVMRLLWERERVEDLQQSLAEELARRKREYDFLFQLVRSMQHAGVGILAGTDSDVAYVIPGFSLHDELQRLVASGLTPLQALQTATLNPAKYFHSDSFGTVHAGKHADLVVLDANPLDNIRNTQKIQAVVINGRYLDRKELDEMLANVEAAARN